MSKPSDPNPGRRRALHLLVLNNLAVVSTACGGGGSSSDPRDGMIVDTNPPAAGDPTSQPTPAAPANPPPPAPSVPTAPQQTPDNPAVCSTNAPPGRPHKEASGTGPAINAGDIEVICAQAVSPGGWMEFMVSDNRAAVGVERTAGFRIERLAPSPQVLKTGSVKVTRQRVPVEQQWSTGTDWPAAYSICVPAEWRSGIYRITFTSQEDKYGSARFVVRAAKPGSTSSIVLRTSFDTEQAYNNWGGKSLYDFNSPSGRGAAVSGWRPLAPGAPHDIEYYIVPFVLCAEKAGINIEFISGHDMQFNPTITDPYRLMLIVGHDEYWTAEMRAALERFVGRGGNLAVFGGNSMWWRTSVATDAAGRPGGTIVCDKKEGGATHVWYSYRSEAAVLGGTYLSGGWLPDNKVQLSAHADYTVYKPQHWAFEGTNLNRGSKFGSEHQIIRIEVDGVRYVLDAQGNPVSTQEYGTPANLEVLAMYQLPAGWETSRELAAANAAFVAYTTPAGGTVINVGTICWSAGLEPYVRLGKWTTECQITRNILLKLR